MRFEREINIYGDEVVLKHFHAVETSVSVVQGKISALISESELTELENSNATMYSKLASAIMEINALTINFSDLTTKYNMVSGQYSELNSKVAIYKASVDELSADISSVQQNLSKNYSTTSQMNTAINAKANEITASVSATYVTKNTLNNYSTTSAMNTAIAAKVNELSLSVSSTYSKKTDLTAATGRIEILESWKNEASLKITDSAIISTVTKSSAYQTSVNSLIEQKANSIRLKATTISWSSTYSSMTSSGTLTCKNATIEGTIHSDNGDNEIYMRSATLDFIRGGTDIGNIGTNNRIGYPSVRGLVFDLEYTGDYMTWAYKQTDSSTTYATVFTFSRAGKMKDYLGLWADVDIFMGYNNLYLDDAKNRRIFSYSNGLAFRSNDKIIFEIGSAGTNIMEIDSGGIYTGKILEIGGGGGITAYNNSNLNFYADLNMHGYSVLNSSDERLKENITEISVSPIDIICGLQLRQYDWKTDGRHIDAGLIAQQVLQVLPDAVKQGKDGIYAIDYIHMIPYIIGAIQFLYELQPEGKKKKKNQTKYEKKAYSEEEIEDILLKASPPTKMNYEKVPSQPKKTTILTE